LLKSIEHPAGAAVPKPLSLLSLLESEGPRLHALLARITLSAHAAEDLMQDLFLKLAASPAFAAARDPAAYARRAAIHLAYDWRRSQPPSASLAADPSDPAPPPFAALSDHEQWSRLLDHAAALPELTREAFARHYLQHESFAAIAASLDKTPHQIRALCHKAIAFLRSQFPEASHAPR
jgi:RNA polymerase sigma-70 factor (ECF subfamily)